MTPTLIYCCPIRWSPTATSPSCWRTPRYFQAVLPAEIAPRWHWTWMSGQPDAGDWTDRYSKPRYRQCRHPVTPPPAPALLPLASRCRWGADFWLVIGGEMRPMCCPGCRAVASSSAPTAWRTSTSSAPPITCAPRTEVAALEQYLVYDDPALAAVLPPISTAPANMTARLLLGGISCAACTWLIEQTMARLPGVSRALVNLQQSRLDIQFDPARIP